MACQSGNIGKDGKSARSFSESVNRFTVKKPQTKVSKASDVLEAIIRLEGKT